MAILGSSPATLHLYNLSAEEFNAPFVKYIDWLGQTNLPVLLLSFTPGVLVGEESIAWAEETIANLTYVPLGAGAHFVQEDQPDAIGKAIAWWHTQTFGCNRHHARFQQ